MSIDMTFGLIGLALIGLILLAWQVRKIQRNNERRVNAKGISARRFIMLQQQEKNPHIEEAYTTFLEIERAYARGYQAVRDVVFRIQPNPVQQHWVLEIANREYGMDNLVRRAFSEYNPMNLESMPAQS